MNYADIFEGYPDVVTTNEMMAMLRIGRNKAYELLNRNVICSIRIGSKGRTRYILKQSIIEYLKKQISE